MKPLPLLPALCAALLLAACANHAADPDSPLAPSSTEARTPVDAPAADGTDVPVLPPLPAMSMNEIGAAYVQLVLALGELQPGYVDAYYGPVRWQETAHRAMKPAAQIAAESQQLIGALKNLKPDPMPADPALVALRAGYLRNQLGALSARARMQLGLKLSFDDEARALYDIVAPHYHEGDFKPVLEKLDRLLPKKAGSSLSERYNRYIDQFSIPPERLLTVMNAAISAARSRTRAHLALPQNERFELGLVTDKPWSAYNYYQGNGLSRIEVNTDLPIGVARAIELASHEGYPGHHVYNSLLEAGLVRTLGWSEYEVYPLFSPQSMIAEGTADFGVELAFPGREKLELTQQLFKLAGFDPKDARNYLQVVDEGRRLAPAVIEAARHYLDGRMDAATTERWLVAWTLSSPARAHQRVKFFDTYGSYIVNYTYGEELVRGYVERHGGTQAGSPRQWEAFRALLSTPRVPSDLLAATDSPTVAFPMNALAPTAGPPLPEAVPVAAPAPASTVPAGKPARQRKTARDRSVEPEAPDAVHGKVTDLVDFEGFMLTKPTPAQFHARFPDVQLVLPGQITTKEFRLDHSRYFAKLDEQGRIISGKFM